jgi:hypothetical protein
MEISLKRLERPLPDSTTTFLSVKEMEAEAEEAVATLQVSTDTAEMEQFSDLFNVTSCSEPFTLIDSFANGGLNCSLDPKLTPLSRVSDFSLLQSTSTNPILGTAVLTNINSEVMVTSTTQSHHQQADHGCSLSKTSFNSSKNTTAATVISSVCNNDLYTLTLTDGSVVQLRVQNEPQPPEDITTLSNVSAQNWLSDQVNGLQTLITLPSADMHGDHRSSSGSPASFVEEVTLPFIDSASSPLPTSAADLLNESCPSSPRSFSAVSPTDVLPNIRTSSRRKVTATRSFSVCSEDSNNYSASASAGSDDRSDDTDNETDDAALLSMFSSVDKVTIESLKAKLSALPDGQTDLGALLVAAKIDLTVEDVVGPPLTTVKKIMEANGLSDWQMTLCLKIRRRKKNTVSTK